MLTPAEQAFAQQLVAEAKASGHPWPGYAAAEAFLESASYAAPSGESGLALATNDVFGLKEPSWWQGQVYEEQTREVLNGISVMEPADWPEFPTLAAAFAARLTVLKSMPGTYGEALAAQDGAEFVRLVSAYWSPAAEGETGPNIFTFPSGTYQFVNPPPCRWSTAPNRASEVLATYNSHPEIFAV